MAGRILRIELRRSVALWAALVIAAVGVFVLFASNEPYGSWMQLVIVQREIMQLTWPLALAAGAWQGIRERRCRIEELLDTTPRPRWVRVLPVAGAMAIGAVATYLVMLAGAAGHLRNMDSYFSYGAVPLVALGALAFVAAVWLGLAIGALLPSPLTAPILVVVGFLGLALSPMLRGGEPGTLLLFPYLQGPRDGGFALQMLSARANLSQTLWLAALAATGLALFAAARARTRVAALLPVIVGAAIAVPAMPRQLAAAWVEDGRATEVICTPDAPRICLPRVYSHLLDDLREPAGQALSVLAVKLPPAPTQVRVELGDKAPESTSPPDAVVLRLPLVEDLTEYTSEDLVWLMLNGAGVPPCGALMSRPEIPVDQADAADFRYGAARLVAAAWLLDRDLPPAEGRDEGPEGPLAREALAALRALPADEQRNRVAAFRHAERTCADADRLELLTGMDGSR